MGETAFIPRMSLTPSNADILFKFQRRQFSVTLCFAMTINKSHGQSSTHVGLYLPRPVFTHEQLYVALSRVKSRKCLKILVLDDQGSINKCQAAYWSSNLKDNIVAIRLCCSNIELVAKFNLKSEVIITEHRQQVLLSNHAVDIFVNF
ncbi:uncharacterized protein LOC130744899 [Lotus japonicus]|uniref:uncharacterized protein LOC130744899 n=1 Tax=Lotus japonicus TaxID=34305 RepID=UPI00258E6CA9|nr:uncharacterized protein LOC130744899 [Lotus japonicus]